MIAVDTNVLVYAHRADSPHHISAGCGHVVTRPRLYRPPTTPAVAVEAVQSMLALPNLRLLPETADHGAILAGLLQMPGGVGPKVHDARIAAICLGHGMDALWSADRDFSGFPELRVINPLTG